MRGHLYCSERCARDAGRHAVWRRVRGALVTPVPARLAVVAVALAAAAPVLLALRTVRELDGLNASSPLRAAPRARPPTARLETDRRRRQRLPARGNRLRRDRGLPVRGPAPARLVAGRERWRFRFDGVRERGPFRVGAMPLSSPLAYAPTPAPTPVRSPLAAAAPAAIAAEAPPAPRGLRLSAPRSRPPSGSPRPHRRSSRAGPPRRI